MIDRKADFQSPYGAVLMCTGGAVRCTLDGVGYTLQPRQGLFVVPGSILAVENDAGDGGLVRIDIERNSYRSVVIDRQAWDIVLHIRSHPLLTLTDTEIGELTAMQGLVDLIRTDTLPRHYASYQRRLMMDVMLYELLNLVARRLDNHNGTTANSASRRQFLAFIDVLEKGSGRIRSVSEVADKLCVSPKYIARIVKDVSGMTPSAWIKDYSAREAVRMLRFSERPVKVIAQELGFPNASFFGTWFKKQVGSSPMAYRVRDIKMEDCDVVRRPVSGTAGNDNPKQ